MVNLLSTCIHFNSLIWGYTVVIIKQPNSCNSRYAGDIQANKIIWATPYHTGVTLKKKKSTSVLLSCSLKPVIELAVLTQTNTWKLHAPVTGLMNHSVTVTCSGGTGQIRHSDERWEMNTGWIVHISFWAVGHAPQMSLRQPESGDPAGERPWFPQIREIQRSKSDERHQNKQAWLCWWRSAHCATSWVRAAGGI